MTVPWGRGRRPLSQAELDEAYAHGMAMEAAEKAERMAEYDNSPEQADWEGDEDDHH